MFLYTGWTFRCLTTGLIGGSPRKRSTEEAVLLIGGSPKKRSTEAAVLGSPRKRSTEEAVLLYCADNQICMISGNTKNPASAQSCAELLPGYADDACQEEEQDGAFTCWCSSDSCNESKEKIQGIIANNLKLSSFGGRVDIARPSLPQLPTTPSPVVTIRNSSLKPSSLPVKTSTSIYSNTQKADTTQKLSSLRPVHSNSIKTETTQSSSARPIASTSEPRTDGQRLASRFLSKSGSSRRWCSPMALLIIVTTAVIQPSSLVAL